MKKIQVFTLIAQFLMLVILSFYLHKIHRVERELISVQDWQAGADRVDVEDRMLDTENWIEKTTCENVGGHYVPGPWHQCSKGGEWYGLQNGSFNWSRTVTLHP